MIDLRNVEKTYYSNAGDIHALKKTNLHINAGEIFGIIGLSGAGEINPDPLHQYAGSTYRRSGLCGWTGTDCNEQSGTAQSTPKYRDDLPAL